MYWTKFLALQIACACARYDRLAYLKSYEDEPVDEFLETLKPNMDGSTFLDDSYFIWLSNRYAWRRGAENFDPMKPGIEPKHDELTSLLHALQSGKESPARPIPLSDVVDDEWRLWQMDPEFPNEATIEKMGVAELFENGYRWVDEQESELSEPSIDAGAYDYADIYNKNGNINPVYLDEADTYGDLQ